MYINADTLACLDAGKPKQRAKRNKYNAKKVVIDGIKFDSIGEGRRYQELKLQEHCGVISGLELQPEFVLQEKFKVNGKVERAIKYRADFWYLENGEMVVEDFKGKKTEVYKIKRKMFLKKFPEYKFLESQR